MTIFLIYLAVAAGVLAAALIAYYALRWEQAKRKAGSSSSLIRRLGLAFGTSLVSTTVWALPLTVFSSFWWPGVAAVFSVIFILVVIAQADESISTRA